MRRSSRVAANQSAPSGKNTWPPSARDSPGRVPPGGVTMARTPGELGRPRADVATRMTIMSLVPRCSNGCGRRSVPMLTVMAALLGGMPLDPRVASWVPRSRAGVSRSTSEIVVHVRHGAEPAEPVRGIRLHPQRRRAGQVEAGTAAPARSTPARSACGGRPWGTSEWRSACRAPGTPGGESCRNRHAPLVRRASSCRCPARGDPGLHRPAPAFRIDDFQVRRHPWQLIFGKRSRRLHLPALSTP